MPNYNPDTYCSLAFSGFDTRAKSICCHAKINSKINSYTEAMSLPIVTKLQQDLLNGIKSPVCNQCWSDESVGIESMRVKNFTGSPTEKKLKRLVIDSGNVCNLACRTCGPGSSSSHIKEFEAKHNKKFHVLIKKTDIDYLKTEDYSKLEFISVLGGEPFQNLDHLEILELIVEQGYAKNCQLTYVTNGTISLSSKIKKLFNNFKNVGIVLSVDAVDDQFEYIRTNGKWNILNNNVNNLIESREEINSGLHSRVTVSALNILYLDELFQWFFDRKISYDIGFCNSPSCYSFKIFNDQQKSILIKHLEQSKFNMSSIIQHLDNSKFDKDSLAQFYLDVEFTKNFKKLDIQHYLPRLIELLRRVG